MNLYQKYVLPGLIQRTCSSGPVMKQRQKIVPQASGKVLEIGIGTGLNLPFYKTDSVERLYGLDPSELYWEKAEKEAQAKSLNIEFIKGIAEDIPLESHSIDTIVITYTLCSIPNLQPSFSEFGRVLKSSGRLLFCEHGAAPDKSVRRWQNILNPIWSRLGGGCHLNKPIPEAINKGGFNISKLETMYIPGFKPASFNYWGVANPA